MLARIDEASHLDARAFVFVGGALAQRMDAAMDVGVDVRVVALQRIDHRLRLLRGGGIVEIDQRLAVHRLAQDGKILAPAGDIACHCDWREQYFRFHFHHNSPKRVVLRQTSQQNFFKPGRKDATRMRSMTSCAKACTSSLRAAGRVDAARAQIEQLRFVELPDGGAVSAFHIVGVNFQFRLGVDFRIPRQQQIVVGLEGIGLLRAGMHDHLAVEYARAWPSSTPR